MALTKKQRVFATAIAKGANRSQAARVAGYSDKSDGGLRQTAHRTASLPEVQRAAHAERERILCSEGAPLALATLQAIMSDSAQPAAARVSAAKWTLEAAGHGLEAAKLLAKIGEGDDRAVSQLSAADLERLVMLAADKVQFERAAVIDADILPQNVAD